MFPVHTVATPDHVDTVGLEGDEAMSDILRWSYMLTLPFFNLVALLSNAFIICIFSVEKMKRYRASVYFRYVAMVDMVLSVLLFGFMWLAIVLPSLHCPSADRALHCKLYTVFRYTAQDLSAWGLVCLVLERCSSNSGRLSKPSCFVLTLCKYQWVLRHLPSKLLLIAVSVLTLSVNTTMVFAGNNELSASASVLDCFNSWKSPDDFTYESVAMSHVLLSVVLPSLSSLITCLCLRVLLTTRPRQTRSSPDPNRPCLGQPGLMATGDHRFTQCRWIHLEFNNANPPSECGMQNPVNIHPPDVTPATTNTPSDVTGWCRGQGAYGSSFLDRLYAMVKSREFVLSLVHVEDSRLAAQPTPELTRDFNAMASMAALFFVLAVQPQLLFVVVGCMRRDTGDWAVLKNIGLATDLVSNNRINFTFFLYVLISGRRISNTLLRILGSSVAFCCPCLSRLPAAPWNRARPPRPGQDRQQDQSPSPTQCPAQSPGQAQEQGLATVAVVADDSNRRLQQYPGQGHCQSQSCRLVGISLSGPGANCGASGDQLRDEGQGDVEVVPKPVSIMTPS